MQIEKPRIFQSSRDLFMTLGVLLLVTFLTVGFTGLCSFNPGGAKKSGPVTTVDKDTILRMDAMGLKFPIRNPEMPEGWVANSARRVSVNKEPSSLVGWVIDGEHYISLTQTSAPYKKAIAPDDSAREETGTEKIGDVEWHKFSGEDVRPIWVADLGDVRLILEAMASEAQIRTAAERVTKAQPIDVSSRPGA